MGKYARFVTWANVVWKQYEEEKYGLICGIDTIGDVFVWAGTALVMRKPNRLLFYTPHSHDWFPLGQTRAQNARQELLRI